jgi:hypothetical protein
MEEKQRRGELAPEETEGCEPEGTDAGDEPQRDATKMATPHTSDRGPNEAAEAPLGPSGPRTGREYGDTGEGQGWMPPTSDSPDDAE